MPYLEIKKQQTEETIPQTVEMPNVIGMSIKDAKSALNELGLEVEIENSLEQEVNSEQIIIDQLPKKGIQINQGTKVTVYVQ